MESTRLFRFWTLRTNAFLIVRLCLFISVLFQPIVHSWQCWCFIGYFNFNKLCNYIVQVRNGSAHIYNPVTLNWTTDYGHFVYIPFALFESGCDENVSWWQNIRWESSLLDRGYAGSNNSVVPCASLNRGAGLSIRDNWLHRRTVLLEQERSFQSPRNKIQLHNFKASAFCQNASRGTRRGAENYCLTVSKKDVSNDVLVLQKIW